MAYASISVEGGIFPSDLLDRIATGDAEGQRDGDFQSGSARLSDATQSAFSDMRAYWAAFQRRLGHSGNRTTVTRETWMVPLLETLGYKDHGNTLSLWRPAPQIDGVTYAISHRAGQAPDSTPVHIVSIEQSLDRRAEGSRRSAHATVQEFLNRAPALWGIATNGAVLRLLRDTQISSRPTYVEFDLRAMVEDNLYSEFVLLYRLLQRTRLPKGGDDPNDCLLESYYQLGIDEGGRVREHLREGVEVALEGLGNALLAHPESGALREALRDRSLDQQTYYRQLLRLIYRLLFLMVAEERKLLLAPDSPHASRQQVYQQYYGIARLRDRAERRFAEDRYIDLWEGLLQTFLVFREEDLAGPLGLSALNGELFGAFACGNLEVAGCENRHLLRAIYHLSTFKDGDTRRRVNYAGLDVEELGSVYESLLDLQPRIELDPPRFTLIGGNERKATGSYYTPPQLVRELVESALVPVMEDRLRRAGTRDEQEQALLDLRICDPACGSGHFLLAAARRVAGELARVRSGGDEPAPEAYRAALRETIRSCIYAVDRNPLAVDLCKVALWIEGFNAGLPLSFLDNHIKWGDSLVGVFDLEVLEQGIPDGAYTPVTGDDKASAGGWKKLNGQERGGQRGLLGSLPAPTADVAAEYRRLGLQEERTPYEVHAKERDYQRIRGPETDWWRDKTACDLWTAAFFLPIRTGEEMPTSGAIRDVLQHQGSHPQLVGRAVDISQKHPFFHWPLEFPDVFDRGGFDVVLGNPPWERIKLQEQEFFAQRDPEIAGAPNKAERERLIKSLPERRPVLAAEFEAAKHTAEAASKFVRLSARFPLCGRGDVNTYSIFAYLNRTLVGPGGRAGCITPSGIATDDTTKLFFADLMKRRSLASLYDFENGKIFPEVDSRYRFCLLTMTAEAGVRGSAEFAFFLHDAAELGDAGRRLALSTED
ncbi:MAG: Eco57I restriction-modification methylase domain-containing protein, partial [Chloroflexota bacterium]